MKILFLENPLRIVVVWLTAAEPPGSGHGEALQVTFLVSARGVKNNPTMKK